jgi:glycosyltransferase involved in cell wall biosynthesis
LAEVDRGEVVMSERIPVLYLAPWVGYGGSDKNTIDWFRWIDRDRFAPYLLTTQASPNPLLHQVEASAEEVWVLPDLMPTELMPHFIFDFICSRRIQVIHLMNSRLGFDLLPDLEELPEPPAVVVQMHAEETDRSGYVRYVTTRYGDLVDCFSLSNQHVADAVRGYGIPDQRTRVIYTGADADGEFDPSRARPIEELPNDRLQILFAARLVAQKDPLLMVEVAAALREEGAHFQIHVVGEGDLEGQIEGRIAELGLEREVIMHPAVPGLVSWYAACDVLLLTSTFEGIPVVIFEAMAMGLPIITPGLPAIREMLGEEDEGVVLPRDSVSGYVERLARLARDRGHLAARGGEMRSRARGELSVRQMAADHERLYEELVGGSAAAAAQPSPAAVLPVIDAADLGAGLRSATSPLVAATTVGGRAAFNEAGLCEKVLRRFQVAGDTLDAIALTDAGEHGRFGFRALPLDDGPADPVPQALIWRREVEKRLPQGIWVDREAPVASLTRLLGGAGARIEWRHLAGSAGEASPAPCPPQGWAEVEAAEWSGGEEWEPPGSDAYRVQRWENLPSWMPTNSVLLTRYRQRDGERRIATGELPPGFEPELVLGCLRSERFQGTEPLQELGFVELAPLPGMDSLSLGAHRDSGERIPVIHPDDPLLAEVDIVDHLGFLDPVPPRPREIPPAERFLGLVPLVKSIDLTARRHRCTVGTAFEGELLTDLGAISESELGATIPVWIIDGVLVTDRHRPPTALATPATATRWALEPLGWRDLAPRSARAKAIARRAASALGAWRPRRAPAPPASRPDGWLFGAEGPGLAPLYVSYHPVTRDQLLMRNPATAVALGYLAPQPLGYVRDVATLADDSNERELPIPWARRFGHVRRND